MPTPPASDPIAMKSPHSTILAIAAIVFPNVVSGTGGGNFNYSYDIYSPIGPFKWYEIDTGNTENLCFGDQNSPVDFRTMKCGEYADYQLTPSDCTASQISFSVERNGIMGTYPTDGTCTLHTMVMPGIDDVYEAVQFHIHIISEHTFNGAHYGAELHIVHQPKSKKNTTELAVIGIILEPNNFKNDALFETILSHTDVTAANVLEKCGREQSNAATSSARNAPTRVRDLQAEEGFDVYSLLNSASGFYHYLGSLTLPPCTENVLWNVADTHTYISARQYGRMIDLVLSRIDENSCEPDTAADPNTGGTARPAQALLSRTVRRICPTDTPNQSQKATGSNCDSQSSSATASLATMMATLFSIAVATAFMLE